MARKCSLFQQAAVISMGIKNSFIQLILISNDTDLIHILLNRKKKKKLVKTFKSSFAIVSYLLLCGEKTIQINGGSQNLQVIPFLEEIV
jgi:hypothetical protein